MADLSQYSDEELMDMAGISNSQSDLSQFSDEELFQMAGIKQPESSFLGSIWEGVKAAPSAAVDMVASIPSGVSNIYESIFTPNKAIESGAAERVLRGTGALASGSAGSIAGGALGALGGPLAPLTVPLGVAAGGAAGTSLYDLVNELFGNDAPTTRDVKIDKFGKNLGTGIALAGAGKAGGAGVSKFTKNLSNTFDDLALATKERALGIQYGDRKRGFGSNSVYLDETGNAVPKNMAIDKASSIQTHVKNLEDSGFLKQASNDPAKALTQLDRQHLETELLIDNLIDKADTVVGNQSILPAWSRARQFLDGLRKSERDLLTPELERIRRDYIADPNAGMRKIINLKRQLSEDAKFASNTAPKKAELYQQAYLDLKQLGEDVFDAAVPSQKGAFRAANELASSEIGIQKTLPTAAARDNAGIFKTLFTPTGSGPYLGAGGLGAATLGTGVALPAAATAWLARGVYQGIKNTKPLSMARGLDNLSYLADLFSPVGDAINSASLPVAVSAQALQYQKGEQRDSEKNYETQKDLPGVFLDENLSPKAQTQLQQEEKRRQSEKYQQSHNTPTNDSDYIASSLFSPAKAEFKSIEAEIDKNPYYSALYEAESGRNPKAKNPKSTATGGFQFIKATAKSLGLDDPKDLAKSYEAVQRFTDEHRQRFGDDPGLLYAAHFLGAPLLSKVISNKNLSDEEEQQVSELRTKAMPRFLKIFNRINQNQLEA